jgi:hypothetical protein
VTDDLPRSGRPKKTTPVIQKTLMLTVFFDYHGVMHSKFLPEGPILNKEYYFSVMRRLREQMGRKGPDLWKENSWILQ